MRYCFDSNLLIYHLNGNLSEDGRALIRSGIREGAAYALVTRIEILGFSMDEHDRNAARLLLGQFREVGLTEPIVERTIALRARDRGLKIPDAMVAATALELGLPLVTHDKRQLVNIAGLDIVDFPVA